MSETAKALENLALDSIAATMRTEMRKAVAEQAQATESEFRNLITLMQQSLEEVRNRLDAHSRHLHNLDEKIKALK